MAKAGRALEELVATLETLLSNSPVEIRSPDFIMGKTTHTPREVDVSLRTRVGSAAVLVIIECRDRARPENVQWIDAIVGKQEEVGANKAVAVSRSGFTATARARAQAKGIELRTLEEVNSASVWDWLDIAFMAVRVNNLAMTGAQILLPDTVPAEAEAAALSIVSSAAADSPILVRTSDGTPASLNDVWRAAPQSDLLCSLLPGETKRGAVHMAPSDPSQWYIIPIQGGTVAIAEIVLEGNFRVDEREVPITRFEYLGEDGALVEGTEVEITHEGSTVKMGVHSAPDGKMLLTVQQPNGTNLNFQANLLLQVTGDGEGPTHAE